MENNRPRQHRGAGSREGARSIMRLVGFAALALLCCATSFAAGKLERPVSYTNEVLLEKPWSIHVVKVDRTNPDLRLYTALGGGDVLGMGMVTDQLKSVPGGLGVPVAAINGDFFEKSKDYPARPRDLQIRNGQLITHPAGHTCFWIDAGGIPHMTNVYSRFHILWPDGKTTPVLLNIERTNDGAVLYTSVSGPSTHTKGGLEYILERNGDRDWIPLRAGQTYEARVREVRNTGDSPVTPQTIVLSIAPTLSSRVPALKPGDTVSLAMETTPDLSGVDFAIGGGPALIRDRHLLSTAGWTLMRHPRTAIGYNDRHIFLVVVDGRQIDLSLGMTFPELAQYLLKLGCDNAMNLDGGGSATLWAFGAVRNSPSEGQERPSPNSVVVLKKGSRATAAK